VKRFSQMKRTVRTALGLLGLSALLCAGQAALADDARELNPDGRGHHLNVSDFAPTAGGTGSLTPITNHGGPIMGTPNVYLIWYGNWNQSNGTDTPAGQALVRAFLGSVGGSPYYQINTTYGATGNVNLSPLEYTDTGSQGTRLSDAKVKTVVSNAIATGQLGSADTNGLYFVLTSSNVSESSGFCSRYCGWHTHGTITGQDIKYSFVGNAARCLSGCAAQTISPNGNAGVDGMISVIAHELEEANSDPDLNAWYDSSGAENADKCAWTFGSAQTLLPSGAYYNMTLGGKNYLIQRNLDASNNKCYVSYKAQQ
jgi:hypothetical protein